jgi:hypothetical protein
VIVVPTTSKVLSYKELAFRLRSLGTDNLRQALRVFRPNASREGPWRQCSGEALNGDRHLSLVSDPEPNTPSQLKAFSRRFDPRWKFVE